MATTKTEITVQASATVTAGVPLVSALQSLSTSNGTMLSVKITNGGTPPTVAASCLIEQSHDGTTWKYFAKLVGDTLVSPAREWPVLVPKEVANVRTTFTDNTGQDVTAECTGTEVTIT